MLCLDSEKIEEFIELTTPNQYLAPHLVQTGFTTPLVRCVQALGETDVTTGHLLSLAPKYVSEPDQGVSSS